jgi:hypothetical protein
MKTISIHDKEKQILDTEIQKAVKDEKGLIGRVRHADLIRWLIQKWKSK